MAKMIPKRCPRGPGKRAERKIFTELENDPNTEGWSVLHSMELANRGIGKPYGEIDFVIIIPEEGIVCLEVKGGKKIQRKDGEWSSIDKKNEIHKIPNPFTQAKDSTFALKKAIEKKFEGRRESLCPVGRMIAFPSTQCPDLTPEFERWEVIDSNDLSGKSLISSLIKKAARNHRKLLHKPAPTASEAREIRNYLRPDFERVIKKNILLKEADDELLRLTEEQYRRIDALEENPRCLFKGAAGTGKTMLAVEFARRKDWDGEKVLLVCYNQLLSQWLREQTKEFLNVTTGTFHGVMKNLIEKSSYKKEFFEIESDLKNDQELYDEIYPEYGKKALEELGPQYDLLVMDEAQDLCKEAILSVFNSTIHGGLSDGHWAIFGDFSRQIINRNEKETSTDISNPASILEDYAYFTNYKLEINCRNTKSIAEATYLLSRFENPPLMPGREDGPPVEYDYWKGYDQLITLLEGKIKSLLQQEIPLEDIVILSPKRLLEDVKEISGFPLADISRNLEVAKSKETIKFSTTHSFKGLESRVIIVLGGKREVESNNSQFLFYVSTSRAKSLLVLLIEKRARRSIEKLRRSSSEK